MASASITQGADFAAAGVRCPMDVYICVNMQHLLSARIAALRNLEWLATLGSMSRGAI